MDKKTLKQLVDTGRSFMRKRGGANFYRYDGRSAVYRLRNDGNVADVLYIAVQKVDEMRIIPRPYVRITKSGRIEFHDETDEAVFLNIDGGEIRECVISHNGGGRILEEVIPIFTDKMHLLRYKA